VAIPRKVRLFTGLPRLRQPADPRNDKNKNMLINFIKIYLIAVPVFFVIDLLWLGIVAKGIYQKYLGHLLKDPNWPVAVVFYLLFIVGMVIFAISPALEKQSLMYALGFGALFGFFTYMTYDLTNWATLKDWPWQIVFIDTLWGTVLSASVSTVTYLLVNKLFTIT
jgi:uncharacterized membrane protein